MCGVYPGVSLEARQKPVTICVVLHIVVRSIGGNNIGAQGAASVAKALETNSSLRELKYATKQTLPHNLHPKRQKPLTVLAAVVFP